MTEADWNTCTDLRLMLAFLQGKASERKWRLFACACWRWRYTRAAPQLLRWTAFWLMLGPLGQTEEAADDPGRLRPPAWWGSYTFALPDPRQAVEATVATFQEEWLRLNHWSTDQAALCRLLRDLFGPVPFRTEPSLDPYWLAWDGGTVRRLAESAYKERELTDGTLDPARLAVLADALEDAGCDDGVMIRHCREPGAVHVRGCWVVDALLGKW